VPEDGASWTDRSRAVALTLCSVGVQDLVIEADIGVYDHEINQPQRLSITVDVEILPVADDDIGDTLDYVQIVSLAETLGRIRTGLIETFARRLASSLLAHPRAISVDVRIVKPAALSAGAAFTRILLRQEDEQRRGAWR
jgi:7,8-dihydroneopterin aldolase/epimerase/oxygenase